MIYLFLLLDLAEKKKERTYKAPQPLHNDREGWNYYQMDFYPDIMYNQCTDAPMLDLTQKIQIISIDAIFGLPTNKTFTAVHM